MTEVYFNSLDIEFELSDPDAVASWIQGVIASGDVRISQVDYIFVSNTYILQVNQEHLKHDYFTDIITFPLLDPGTDAYVIDIFLSIDQVRIQAEELGIPFLDELHRVMVHGVLHVMGWNDKSEEEALAMRKAENEALLLRNW